MSQCVVANHSSYTSVSQMIYVDLEVISQQYSSLSNVTKFLKVYSSCEPEEKSRHVVVDIYISLFKVVAVGHVIFIIQ